MSQDGQDRPSVLRAARERTRAEITRQILDAARRHLATEGASGLSLRAIARELGASSSAVYRYVASRDDLLTRLIVAAYDALGAAAEAAEAAVARADLAGRWSAVCGAVRAWALANLADAAGHPAPAIAGADIPPDGRKALAPARSTVGPEVPGALLQRGLMAWAALFGTVSFELFGQLHGIVGDPPGDHQAFFAESVRRWAAQVGITPDHTAPEPRKPDGSGNPPGRRQPSMPRSSTTAPAIPRKK